jgi:predicted ABC-type ATPase
LNEKLKLRIIGGPNGSGKSYFINEIKDKKYFQLRIYINADEIEKLFENSNKLDLSSFNVIATQDEFVNHIESSTYKDDVKLSLKNSVSIIKNNFILNSKMNSYHSAILADFIRIKLLENNQSFTFETVMSHISKIDFLEKAKLNNYKIYFYFICTESVELNKLQVQNRVKLGGHNVPLEKIESRYPDTLNNLKLAIELSDICYCINNKGSIGGFEKVAEIVNGKEINYLCSDPPNWFQQYYLDKLIK